MRQHNIPVHFESTLSIAERGGLKKNDLADQGVWKNITPDDKEID